MTAPIAATGRIVTRYSANALLVHCAEESPADVMHAIDKSIPAVQESHCGETAVVVRFNPAQTDWNQLRETLAHLPAVDARSTNDLMTLRVRYDGEDLAAVASSSGMSIDEVITRHTATTFRVAFDGFSPGFAYLLGLPPELHLPRRQTPRTRIPAGPLAIAAHYCAVYPSASPGGWHLLGTCNAELFNPHRNPPALLRPGTYVRFEAAR